MMPTFESNPLDESLPIYLQEDLNKETKDLISTLPTEPGWVANHLYLYQGFWHVSRELQGVLACQKHLEAKEGDILLVTTPKSGTTWLKAISFALMNRSRFVNPSNHPLLVTNPHVLVPFLEFELYTDNKFPDFSSYEAPRLLASHLPFNSLPLSVCNSGCKIVYLCRNPKDTFVSLWHFANKMRHPSKGDISLEESFESFCRGVSLIGPFWDHVLGYWKASLERPEKVIFLKYEELKENPNLHLKKLADFMGCPFSPKEEAEGVMEQILKLCSFENLSNLEVNKSGKLRSGEDNSSFFRKGAVGDWMNYLTDAMAERIDALTEEKFHGSGLKL